MERVNGIIFLICLLLKYISPFLLQERHNPQNLQQLEALSVLNPQQLEAQNQQPLEPLAVRSPQPLEAQSQQLLVSIFDTFHKMTNYRQ